MATFDHEVRLIKVETWINENGFREEREEKKGPILANRLSIRSNEYWQAKQNGTELSYTFEVHDFEYAGETRLEHEGEKYDIERTYNKGGMVELICRRRSDNHAS